MTKKEREQQRQEQEARREDRLAELAALASGLLVYYPGDNPIGLMLAELIADLTSGEPRAEVMSDAIALHDKLDANSTAYRVIGRIMCVLA